MPNLTRRNFMIGCSSAVAAMAGTRFSHIAFGNPEDEPNQEIMIVVFLRGGMDVLNFVTPYGGDDRGYYETARPNLQVPVANLLQLGTTQFGMHPAAASLHNLYTNGNLAIVQAAGMHEDTRSHFDAMNYMELGTPGASFGTTGWIARHLDSSPVLPDDLVVPALSMGHYSPLSTLGSTEVLSMDSPDNFNLDIGPWLWRPAQRYTMRQMYSADTTQMHQVGMQTLDAADIIELNVTDDYVPPPGVVYPDDPAGFGDHLQTIAQMIKLQLGLRVVTIDLGGWDTHENQGNGAGGYFSGLLQTLSDGLSALYADLDASGSDYTNRLTIAVKSEFGRRLEENGDDGTDHGHGGLMLVLGGEVNGGLHGDWPTLHPDALYEGIDLEVMTDYRRVLSEILIRRLENPNLGIVFPGYMDYQPLGITQGIDLPPIYDVPTAVSLSEQRAQQAMSPAAKKALTAAGVGVAATASLIALRERGRI